MCSATEYCALLRTSPSSSRSSELKSSSLSHPCPSFPASNHYIFPSTAENNLKKRIQSLRSFSAARTDSGRASDTATEGPAATHLSPKPNDSQKPGPSYLLGPHVCPSRWPWEHTCTYFYTRTQAEWQIHTCYPEHWHTHSLSLLFQSPVDGTRSFNILSCQYQLFLTE